MILERGDMWSVFGKTDLFLITTNPIIRKDKHAVMGAGIAKQAAKRFPSIPKDLATRIEDSVRSDVPSGCGFIGTYDEQKVGYFMVKYHWKEDAKPEIIQRSVDQLIACIGYIRMYMVNPRIDLNFPGIGNGRLPREKVLPIIEKLPDNVHVWEY